ncbi:MAG: hypothetical protein QOE06_3705, partial [Thermoleophilaceae bacterium]|nr:hypothetical protein [Thermoleophilaceae bacterium]
FSGLVAGTYWVSIDSAQSTLSGLTPTQTGRGTLPTDSNVNPSMVVLSPGNMQDETVDFGYSSPGISGIGDFVWNDSNGNGVQDSGEPGLPGLTVNLCSDSTCSTITATTTTDQNGAYHFTALFPGTYYVQVNMPTNFTPSPVQVGSPALDSNGSIAQVLLPDNFTDNTIDFGFVPPAQGAIGDFVWHDLNRNGIQDNSEPGINNVTVQLTDSKGVGTTTNTVSHNGQDGYYQFTGLSAGTYTVRIVDSSVPQDYVATIVNAAGATNANDSNNATGASVTLSTNSSVDETIDFGYVSPCAGAIGDFVWNDLNGNGIQDPGEAGIPGVPVSPRSSSNTQILSTTTGSDGSYRFKGVCAGTYTVQVVPPADFIASTTNAPGSSVNNDSNGSPADVTLGIDETNSTIDFGYYPKLSITCATNSSGEVGAAFTASPVSVSGGVAPYTHAIGSGTLPAGLTLDHSTGVISGTPTEAGSFSITVTDSKGNTVTSSCPYTVIAGPSLACSSVNSGEVGVAFTSPAMMVTGGTAPFTFSVATGALPSGLTLDSTTGAITGTPTAAGTFTIEVTDANHVVAAGTCPFTIVAAPSIACSSVNSGEVGLAFNSPAMVVTGGVGTLTFSVGTGSLPAGLALNASTGAITGTATAPGTFTIQVTDGNGVVAAGTCPFTIVAAPSIACSSVTSGLVGVAFSSPALTVTGGIAPFTFSIATGSLPAGLTLNPSNGAITGTPTTAGSFTIKVTEAKGGVATGTCGYTFVAAVPLTVACAGATGQVGVPYHSSIGVSGGLAPYNYTIAAGSLPGGLSLNGDGTITGTPTGAGTFGYTVKVTDALGVIAYSSCTSACTTGGTTTVTLDWTSKLGNLGNSYAYTVNGVALTAYGFNGSNPAIAGTPTALYSKNDSSTENGIGIASDVDHEINTTSFIQLDISQLTGFTNPKILLNSVQSGESYTIYGSNTLGVLGTLLSGPGTTANTLITMPGFGTYKYIGVRANVGNVLIGALTFTIGNCKIVITAPVDLQCGTCVASKINTGTPYSASLAATGGTGPFTFSITAGALPPGVSLNSITGAISGTPTTAGTYTFTSQVVDADGGTATSICTIVVVAPPINLICGTCGATKAYAGTQYAASLSVTGGVGP